MEDINKYYGLMETSRKKRYDANPIKGWHKNNNIKEWLSKVILENFMWDYWITFTFGRNPNLEEVEEILYKLHYRLDRRILKHREDITTMNPKDRSEWILFPHIDSDRGLHYHGFIKLNVNPHVRSYDNEWVWMLSALKDTTKKLNSILTNNGEIGFRFYNRKANAIERLKMILYSLNNYTRSHPSVEPYPNFDPFLYTIISHSDWKPSYLNKHSRNKIEAIPPRPNRLGAFDLL